MSDKNIDSRVRRTKKLLRQGLTELMAQKSIKKITVRELSELVEINRGTFYLHYKDIYDLVEQIEDEFFNEFESIVMSYTFTDLSNKSRHIIADVCRFLDKNRDICNVLLSDNGDINFVQKLRGFLREKCLTDITNAYHISDLEGYEFLYAYFESGAVGISRYWLSHPESNKTPDDIACLIETIFANGIKGIELEQKK